MKATNNSRCVLLLGNPNTGKSTLFNALSGLRQHVGNYPGVTVEKKEGRFQSDGETVLLVDLPGTYSLAARSPDELVAVEVLMGMRPSVPDPDVVLCVVDASNLERNLYLVSQISRLGVPVVIALTMNDIAARHGIQIDTQRLSQLLGVPVIPVAAQRRQGLDQLKRELLSADSLPQANEVLDPELDSAIRDLQQQFATADLPPFAIERLVLDDCSALREKWSQVSPELLSAITELRQQLGKNGSVSSRETEGRYDWIGRIVDQSVESGEPAERFSDRLDRVLLHPVWGGVVSLLVMLIVFQGVFSIADPASGLIDWLTGQASQLVTWLFPQEGPLQSLLTDGLIAGVGGVLVFLPQIFLLFFFIALLEDSGYLARVACLMDRLMSPVGLSGKSFIPLLSSFACAIPGIMSARVIEDRRDRMVTILIAPLMSCSARLPVYTLLIAAFVPDHRYLGGIVGTQGLTMLCMYLLGAIVAIVVAWLLKRTIFRGETPSFLMELPTYKWPTPTVVARKVWAGGWSFIEGAGTLIVAVTILVWAAAYFPRSDTLLPPELLQRRDTLQQSLAATDPPSESLEAELSAVENQIAGERLRQSFLGRAGKLIEPVIRPLGWDWRIGCAVVASFPAREVVVASLGVLYNLGQEQDEESTSLRETLQKATWDGSDRRVFNLPVALSLMVFFALCAQCVSTLATMYRETLSWVWPVFSFVYMTVLAYVAAWITYQAANMLFG